MCGAADVLGARLLPVSDESMVARSRGGVRLTTGVVMDPNGAAVGTTMTEVANTSVTVPHWPQT